MGLLGPPSDPRRCLLCWQPLVERRSRWRRFWEGHRMPVHSTWPHATDEELDRCWRQWNLNMGIKPADIGPRPIIT